jgi:FAD/FMN-containing dehydrogenase
MNRVSALAAPIVALLAASCAAPRALDAMAPSPGPLCRPSLPCWPTAEQWQRLASRLAGELVVPRSPLEPCRADFDGEACAAARRTLQNPLALEDDPGATHSLGWLDAWVSAPSAYAVVAENPDDIVAAVNFARDHRLRLVVKGTGHDYLGRSSAPDSLLIWTHRMRRVTVQAAFVATGCGTTRALPAVTVEAGTRWLEVYREVTGKHGRYVQGGGCTTVGAAGGFLLGGGFGSWSNKYGTAAAGMLEAHVVTADGKRVVANACTNSDLFWALRGGGGGTYGVVTQVTLMTHPAPEHLGFAIGNVRAQDDGAFRELIDRFLAFYRDELAHEDWGETITLTRDRTLRVSMSFHGMTSGDAERVWQPFLAALRASPDRFATDLRFLAIPGNKMWDYAYAREHFPFAIVADPRKGSSSELFWWASNQDEVAKYWHAYQSRWISKDRFDAANAPAFGRALFEASRRWPLEIHFNKGQAFASAEARQRDRETSMHAGVYQAAALVIIGSSGDGVPGLPGHEPDSTEAKARRDAVAAAMAIVRHATPDIGAYVNEADYFEPDWQRAFWGDNYARLLQIKKKYDPASLFTCHHCVGSEPATPRP